MVGVSVSALDLLKTLAYSWYSSGMAERLIFLRDGGGFGLYYGVKLEEKCF